MSSVFVVIFLLQFNDIFGQLLLTWTNVTIEMQLPVRNAISAFDGRYIWMIGGIDFSVSSQVLNTIYKYDTIDNTFMKTPYILQSGFAAESQSYTQIDNKIYFVAGITGELHLSHLHAIDIASYNASQYIPPIDLLPDYLDDAELDYIVTGKGCLSSYANRIFVVGGECGRISCYNHGIATNILDINTLQWTIGPNLNEWRHIHSCSIVDGVIYVIGGLALNDFRSTIEKWDFINNPDTALYTIISPILDPPRAYHRSISINNGIIILGGKKGYSWPSDFLNNVDLLHIDGTDNEYIESLSPMTIHTQMCPITILTDKIYVFSGLEFMYSNNIQDVSISSPTYTHWSNINTFILILILITTSCNVILWTVWLWNNCKINKNMQ